MNTGKSLSSFLALCMTAVPAQAAKVCQLVKIAELPVTMAATRPLIAGTINGIETHFLADSGAFFSFLSRDAARKLSLRLRSLPWNLSIRGVGGEADARLASAEDFTLAGLGPRTIHHVEFIVSGHALGYGVDGIIGQNILGLADAEFDLANGAIRLFHANGCGGQSLAYWQPSTEPAVVPIESVDLHSPQLIGRAKLNGHSIRLVFDSGAARSMLTLRAAALAGVKISDADVKPAGLSRGLGPQEVETWIARFGSLDLGGEQIKNPRLRIARLDLGDGADMLLGSDFFLSHRLYVARDQRKIYLTYNGGPVFDLEDVHDDGDLPPSTDTSAASQTGPVPTPDPVASGELRRLGAAAAGRHDFRAARAELDHAIALDPANPENYYQRGEARWHEHRLDAALSDFDHTLAIQPDNVAALMSRAALQLDLKDMARATEDFDRAAMLEPENAGLGLKIAELFLEADQAGASIPRFDAWVARNPKDERLSIALQDRCWARAMSGEELDLALADCDTALKRGARSSRAYAGRGLVHLRRGDLDRAAADYRRSLALQPKAAWSLYGLGLAQSRIGKVAEGNRNMQAAIAAVPGISARFAKMGLVP